MISNNNSGFKELLIKHGGSSKEIIYEKIRKFEEEFKKKDTLDKIEPANYQIYLGKSIEYIENIENVISFVQQLSIGIRQKVELTKRNLQLEEFKVQKEVENLEFIKELSSKTEKQAMAKRFLEEKLYKLSNYCDEMKMDYEFSKIYVEDAFRSRELAYAYYQAIKQIIGMK